MFEREVEEYCGNLDESKIKDFIADAFKDGAEYGYNKAKKELLDKLEQFIKEE